MSNSHSGTSFSPSIGGGLGDLAYLIKGLGTPLSVSSGGRTGILLGGGMRGLMVQQNLTSYHSDDYSQIRFTLRDAWNTRVYSDRTGKPITPITTPFRAVNNCGDLLSRTNYTCGGNCLTYQSRPNLHGLKGRFGAVQYQCDKSNVPPSTCNVKYVYDSSDYVTYLKQKAINLNYNDISFGGDNSSGSQSAFRWSHRF